MLMAMLAVAPSAVAQQGAAFRCTFTGAFDVMDGDTPRKSGFERQFVGHRIDALITDKGTVTVTTDVWSLTMQAYEYTLRNRGNESSDWVMYRLIQGGSELKNMDVFRIRTWNGKPFRFTYLWGSTLLVGTCDKPG
jgi:hypothetical protein